MIWLKFYAQNPRCALHSGVGTLKIMRIERLYRGFWVSVCYLGFSVSWSQRLELGRQEQLCTEIIRRHTGYVISTWIISVQWHASVPFDFALVWGMSACIWPKLDICQMPVLNGECPPPSLLLSKVDTVTSAALSQYALFCLCWQPWQGWV